MTNKQLFQIRKEVYNQVYGFDGTVEPDSSLLSFLDVYETKKAIAEFHEVPLRWYPSGKKVYTIGFRLRVFIKMIGLRLKFLYWRYIKR